MAGVVKNMMVRVGADLSGLIGGFKKAGGATNSFAKQASDALRSTTLSHENLTKAMAQGDKNSYIVSLTDQIRELEQEQKAMKAAGFSWGYEGFEQNEALLRSLKSELNDYIKSVRQAGSETDDMEEEVEDLGTATRKSRGWLQNVKNFFSGMRNHSHGAKNGVEGLLKSIRRLGIVSLGLRFVRSIFGELGSIVHQYVSENEALQAQVNTLKSSLGQALAPAINVVTNALSKMMPYIVGISNAIGSLISNLFGSGWTTVADGANAAAKAIGGAGSATNDLKRSLQGFDEITKLNEKNSGGDGGGGSSAASAVEGVVPGWMSNLVEDIKKEIAAGDWEGVGKVVAESLNAGINKLSSADVSLGSKFSELVNNALDTAVGFIQNFSWNEAGELIAKNISDWFTGINWSKLFEGIGSLGGGVVSGVIGLFESAWENISEYFASYIEANLSEFEEVGDAIFQGIWEGLCAAVKNVGKWINENVLVPLVEGFKKTFKIHSPAAHPEIRSIGKNIILGVFEGILEIAKSPLEWIKTNVFDPISQTMQSLFDGSAIAEFTVSVKNTASKWWQSVSDWWSQKVRSVKEFTTSVKNEAQSWWSNVKLWWKGQVGAVESFTTTVKNDAVTWWNNVLAWWSGEVDEVQPFKVNVKNDAPTWWQNVVTWWNNTIGSVTFGADLRNNAATWWNNAKAWWNGEISTVSFGAKLRDDAATWWNNLKEWWATKIGTLELKIKLPSIDVEWGTLSALGQTFNYPKSFKIKWNATGLILDGAQLFGMAGDTLLGGGEAGREALLPLDRNTWWMDKVADRVAQRVNVGPSEGGNITVNLILDGKVITSTVVRNINSQARATGHNPLSAWL